MSSVEILNGFGGTEGSVLGRVVIAAIAFITKKICRTMAPCFVRLSNRDRGEQTPSHIVFRFTKDEGF